jgi:hypothetical protein
MAVSGKVRRSGEDKSLEGRLADTVREFGLAGEILPDGADDAETRGGSEKLVLEESPKCDKDVEAVGAVDFEMLFDIDVVDAVVNVGALRPTDAGVRSTGRKLRCREVVREWIESKRGYMRRGRRGKLTCDRCHAPAAGKRRINHRLADGTGCTEDEDVL